MNSRINFLRKLEFSTIRQNQENAEKLTPCRLGPKRQGLAQNLKSWTLVTRVSEKNLKMLMLAKANCAQLIQSQLQTKIESKYAGACSWKNERIAKYAIFFGFCLKPLNLTKITGKYMFKQNSKKVSWWSYRPTTKVIFRLCWQRHAIF